MILISVGGDAQPSDIGVAGICGEDFREVGAERQIRACPLRGLARNETEMLFKLTARDLRRADVLLRQHARSRG